MKLGGGAAVALAAVVGGLVLLVATEGTASAAAEASRGTAPPGQPGRYFTWAELSRSSAGSARGLDNTPTPAAARALIALVQHVLDPLRVRLGRAVSVTSGYRAPAVNKAVDGAETSQHMVGEAVDLKVAGMTGAQLARFILDSGLPFDQLIWYAADFKGHVHVSFTVRRTNRRQVLYAYRGDDGNAAYDERDPPALAA